jgi:hypothetical protein
MWDVMLLNPEIEALEAIDSLGLSTWYMGGRY